MMQTNDILLFNQFLIESPLQWILAIISTCVICIIERSLNYQTELLSQNLSGDKLSILKKNGLFLLALTLRYSIMLIIMSYSILLFISVVLSMCITQSVIDYLKLRNNNNTKDSNYQILSGRTNFTYPTTPTTLFSPDTPGNNYSRS